MKKNLVACLPACLSGGLLVLCFPAFDYYFLAWVALAPFLVAVYDMRGWQALRQGMLLGFVFFFGTQYWVYHSMHYYGGMPLVSSLAAAALLAVYCSLYTGLFAALFRFKMRETGLPAALLAPLFWTVTEYLRAYALTGFPWSLVGSSQYRLPHLIQIADLTGVYGVTFLVLAVNGALADILITRKRIARMPLFSLSSVALGYLAVFAALVATLAYGMHRLGEDPPGREVRVAVIQGSIDQSQKWDEAYQDGVISTYELLSIGAAGAEPKPDLLVWPEASLPFYYGIGGDRANDLRHLVRGLGLHLLTGAVTVKGEERLANSAVLIGPDGERAGQYDKIHLVPFGEYVPLDKYLFFVNRLAEGIGQYAAGTSSKRLKTPFGEFGTAICYEIIFPGLVRKSFRDGGEFLVTITNDAWFGRTAGPYQHFAMAVLRAVETRKPVVRAANTGVSGFIDSRGRIVSRTALYERTALAATIKTDTTKTFYTRFGDMFVYVCIVLTVVLLVYVQRRGYDKGRY